MRKKPTVSTLTKWLSMLALLLIFLSVSCTYKDRVQPITLPSGSQNMVSINGLQVSATAYVDAKTAQDAFGFNIRKAGLLPVQVSFQNDGKAKVSIIPAQSFLIDSEHHAWPVSSMERTYSRIEKSVGVGESFAGAAKPAFLLGAAGAVAGLAVGIVTGNDIGESVGKGATIGATAGALGGGTKGYVDAQEKIQNDLRDKTLENKEIEPNQIAYGVLFFPGFAEEAQDAVMLKLALSFDGKPQTININL